MTYPERTQEKPFRCDECHNVFNYYGIHHIELRQDSAQSSPYSWYICEECQIEQESYKEIYKEAIEESKREALAFSKMLKDGTFAYMDKDLEELK